MENTNTTLLPAARNLRAFIPVIGLLLTASLFAQAVAPTTPTAENVPASGDKAIKLEAVSVTGSNLKRLDQEKVLPVTVLSKDTLDLRNALSAVEVLTALPIVTNVPTNESQSGGAGVRGDGATINLRGLGAGNTLILLNGRRLAPHPITANDNGVNTFSPNVNQLPNQGISHIDVLRDGASSIYGSEAVAGVINYIMREDYRGSEFRLRYGMPEKSGGESVQGTLTYGTGFKNNKGSFLTTLDSTYRDAIYLRDRRFSANANHTSVAPAPFNVAGSGFDGTTATGLFPSFRIGASTTANYLRPVNGVLGFTTVAPTRAANPEYYLNINDYTMAMPRTARVNWYSRTTYDLNDRITAFADLSYYHSKSDLVRQPIALNAPGSDQFKPLSVDNPYNPYGSRYFSPTGAPNSDGSARLTGTPQAVTWVSGTLKDLAPEHVQVHANTYRLVGGLRGKIFDTWSWESGLLYTRASSKDVSLDAIRESALAASLLKTDASAYNPFGYTFKVSGGAVVPDQVYHNPVSSMPFVQIWRHDGFSSIGSLDLRAGGEVYRLWAGPISVSMGGEFRKESYIEKRDPYAGLNPAGSGLDPNDNDFVTASPKPDARGDRTVASGYAETVIPLVAPSNQIPLITSLELTGSGRFEHYSDFGNTTRPKVGLNWKPYSGAMIRASFNEGFAAPNLATLYAPLQFTVDSQPGQVLDLYRNPVTNEGLYVQKRYTSGNAGLQPSTSIGKSIGLVLEVPKVKGLTLTADYWQVQQANVINTYTDTQIVAADAALLNAYTAAQLAAGKTISQIDLGSGTAAYKGSVDVVRNPVTAADQAVFNAYNAAHPTAPVAAVGTIASRAAKFVNLANGYVSGWDVSVNYALPKTEYGQFNLSTDWSYLIRSYLTKNPPGSASLTTERMNVDGTTRWRGSVNLSWRKGNWSGGTSAYYMGRYTGNFSDSATTTAALYTSLGAPNYLAKIFDSGAYTYRYVIHDNITFNAFTGYRFGPSGSKLLDRTSLKIGVINLFNRAPPLTPGAFGYSSTVAGTQVAGRTWTLELNRQF